MKILIQRVNKAQVSVENTIIGKIKKGYLILIGFCKGDDISMFEKAINKILNLRIFEDENGKMNKNIIDINGEILLVSQFTLCSNLKKGNRPSFDNSLNPEIAEEYFNKFYSILKEKIKTERGQFGAYMQVELVNDGPATFTMEF